MRLALVLPLAMACAVGAQEIHQHDDAEARYTPAYASLATGRVADAPGLEDARAPWPFEALSIGHTMASYQRYGWQPYFHHGIDIRGDEGIPVLAARGGQVVNVGNYNGGSRYYWEVAILDGDGFLWQYHHVDHTTIPQDVKDAFAQGGSVPTGTHLGDIVDWPASTFGEVYTHVHLNVLGADGVYLNPLRFLEDLGDDSGPEIQAVGLLDANRAPTQQASDGYSLWVEVRDLIRHDKFYVPPYHLEVQVDGGEPQVVWTFDRLPGGASKTDFIDDFFVPGKTCGNYRCRKAVIDLGFQVAGRREFPAGPGRHHAVVRVRDLAGHVASRGFSWVVE
jgi:hypothetical protein